MSPALNMNLIAWNPVFDRNGSDGSRGGPGDMRPLSKLFHFHAVFGTNFAD